MASGREQMLGKWKGQEKAWPGRLLHMSRQQSMLFTAIAIFAVGLHCHEIGSQTFRIPKYKAMNIIINLEIESTEQRIHVSGERKWSDKLYM